MQALVVLCGAVFLECAYRGGKLFFCIFIYGEVPVEGGGVLPCFEEEFQPVMVVPRFLAFAS